MVQIEKQVIAALKEEGFGILTEIDVQATLKKKPGGGEKALENFGCMQSAIGESGPGC